MSLDDNATHPTFIRYQRVENILKTEPAFQAKIALKTEIVMKPNGKQHKFSEGVVKTTEAIHKAGQDPYAVSRSEVIRYAMQVIPLAAVNNIGQLAATPSPLSTPRPARTKPKPAAKPVVKAVIKPKAEKPVPTQPRATVAAAPPAEQKDALLCPEIAIYSMLMGARQMVEKHDKSEGYKERVKRLDVLAKEYRDLASS